MPEDSKLWTVLSMLEWATGYFEQNQVPNPRLSIEWLLADVMNIKRLDLYLNYDRPLSSTELNRLRPLVKRRREHEPLQYLTGHTDFLNCRIEVNPNVLIPRSETEQLTEILLHDNRSLSDRNINLLDIGTGSGCIPIAVAKKMPAWRCRAVDISEKALQTARKNAELNNVKVEFFRADLFELESDTSSHNNPEFDLMTSNPPYILPEEKETMEKEVTEFEPVDALFHPNPMNVYRSIGSYASSHLKYDGRLYLECNARFTEPICDDLKTYFKSVEILTDYDEKKRFIKALNPA